VNIMLFYNTDFWPALWAILGGAAALTVLVSLLIATVPAPRRHHRPHTPPPVRHEMLAGGSPSRGR
jgi:hypothetical protein